jgi:ribonucleoside-diphosphate reductase alpha chain
MANSTTDFNGAHLKMRANGNGTTAKRATTHEKASSKTEKPKPGRSASRSGKASRGVRMERHFTTAGGDPLDLVVYERRSSTITNPDGTIVFKMEGAEVPASWSQLATDILI